ncbi:MAG TPA: divalent-cation tolerance protein CutA [Candidatus Polarisedimenticolaceae bacterium]|nr:divalent-cation tolerance protein CutA [Candidatus Polarisedimenticolaceae bacterium]
MPSHAVVLTTAGSDEEASKIASALVERGLAACVSVVPGVRSTYRWEGRMLTESESLLVIKTRRERFEAVRRAIREMHSYDVPEVILLEIADGDPDYLAWIDANA